MHHMVCKRQENLNEEETRTHSHTKYIALTKQSIVPTPQRKVKKSHTHTMQTFKAAEIYTTVRLQATLLICHITTKVRVAVLRSEIL